MRTLVVFLGLIFLAAAEPAAEEEDCFTQWSLLNGDPQVAKKYEEFLVYQQRVTCSSREGGFTHCVTDFSGLNPSFREVCDQVGGSFQSVSIRTLCDGLIDYGEIYGEIYGDIYEGTYLDGEQLFQQTSDILFYPSCVGRICSEDTLRDWLVDQYETVMEQSEEAVLDGDYTDVYSSYNCSVMVLENVTMAPVPGNPAPLVPIVDIPGMITDPVHSTVAPTDLPSAQPSMRQSPRPSALPTAAPSDMPTGIPTETSSASSLWLRPMITAVAAMLLVAWVIGV